MRAALFVLASTSAVLSVTPPASAHGEAAQEAFLRTQTATFFDVTFSESSLPVGDPLVVAGKVRLLDAWPGMLPEPRVAYLTVNVPGPTFVLEDRRIGGRFVPQSVTVDKGKVYGFRMTLRARREGRWHVHPALAVEGTGTLVGPGRWIEVVPGEEFRNPVALATGATDDLETYGTTDVVLWHLVTLAIGGLWVLWWLVPRPLLERIIWLKRGQEQRLITPLDRKVSYGVAIAVVGALVAGNVVARLRHPTTVPLQVHRLEAPELALPRPAVDVEAEGATYDARAAELVLNLRVENHGAVHARITGFGTSVVTFSTASAGRRLAVSPTDAVPPGRTRTLILTMRHPVWREQRLIETHQSQIAIAGLLFLEDDGGRSFVEIRSDVIPRFDRQA